MRKTIIAFAAAAALAAGTLAAPSAKADISGWWLLPAFMVGTWVGAHAGPIPPFPFAHCWYERRKIHGHSRTVRVCG